MYIQFATCERHRTLGFLKKLYPSCAIEDTPDSAGPILVEKDIIRIGDPDFHKGQVFASKGTEAEIAAAIELMQTFHSKAMAARANIPAEA